VVKTAAPVKKFRRADIPAVGAWWTLAGLANCLAGKSNIEQFIILTYNARKNLAEVTYGGYSDASL